MSLMDWEGMRPDRRPLESNVQCPPKRCSCEYVLGDGKSILPPRLCRNAVPSLHVSSGLCV